MTRTNRLCICKECNEEKQHYAKGLCRKCYRKQPERQKKEIEHRIKYKSDHREELRQKEELRRNLHPEKIKESSKKYYNKHYDRVMKRKTNWLNNSKQGRIVERLRSRLRSALFISNNNQRYLEFCGCTVLELKKHIESKFKSGMTWDNYGNNGWHIDHIKPCITFNLENKDDINKCFHYTNIQPLWAKENRQKASRYKGKIITENNRKIVKKKNSPLSTL